MPTTLPVPRWSPLEFLTVIHAGRDWRRREGIGGVGLCNDSERRRALQHSDIADSPAAEQMARNPFRHPAFPFADRQLVNRAESKPLAYIVSRWSVVHAPIVVVRVSAAILAGRGSDVVGVFQKLRIGVSADEVQPAREALLNTNHAGVVLTRSEEHTSELQSHLNLVC